MKILLASVLLLLASTPGLAAAAPAPGMPTSPQVADNAERLELARQFVALSQPASDLFDMVRQSAKAAAAEQIDPDADEAERAEVEKRIEMLLAKVEPKFNARRPAIVEAYAQAYARQFSAVELGAMVAFGSSAAGKHYLSSTVAIETDPVVAVANQSLSDTLFSVLDDYRKQSCAEHAQQRVAMGDKTAVCPLTKADESRSL
jgi:hypothetical protein